MLKSPPIAPRSDSSGRRKGARGRLLAASGALAAILATALAATGTGTDAAVGQGASDQPNVLVILTDDQAMSDMDAMPKTKRLVGRKGVSFRRAWATFPLCCPSRATLLSGQYAHNTGVLSNGGENGGIRAFDDTTTTALALDAAGYRTGYIGKYLNGYTGLAQETDPPYVPPGWDRWQAAVNVGRMFDWTQVVDGEIHKWRDRPRDYQTDVLADQADEFIRSSLRRRQPFFATVATLAPHGEPRRGVNAKVNPRPAPRHEGAFAHEPLPKLPSFSEADVSDKPQHIQQQPRVDSEVRARWRGDHRDRLASLLAVDDLVERLVKTLREQGALRDTLVVFTSDNGFMLGEHRLRGKNQLYRESAWVPLFARGPGLPSHTRVHAPVGNHDIAATIYALTGADPSVPPDGISLLDVAADPSDYADRDLVVQTTRALGIRNGDYLYVEHESGERELYDSSADPYELESRHDDDSYDQVRSQLAQRLQQLEGCQANQCR